MVRAWSLHYGRSCIRERSLPGSWNQTTLSGNGGDFWMLLGQITCAGAAKFENAPEIFYHSREAPFRRAQSAITSDH
ncbi:uncharacterized protein BJ212DRAFT_1366353 [Suillus subaureus]|uniref:Uncharacterized protein n=1 Tax=Suillus subaureus TaxID=48587 RepID=A0A9P7JC50_9AGAM|nr:uncharacterized protein BJ212DRAFT_1366353 [Suillus subaureus]KAG1813648.1 hypothetical protein BJ212DRAFT_1366353 [Suillus subaureus]